MAPALGKLVRMRALRSAELPAHSDLAPQQSSVPPPELQRFVLDVLEEAEGFMSQYLVQTFKVKDKSKKSPPSTASVELLSHEINATDIPKETKTAGAGSTTETWFARASVHENAAKEGTASWDEFDQGLRANHSQHEMEYTPGVQDAHKILDWNSDLEAVGRRVGTWEDVEMGLVEMVHHIPPPLNDRCFSVLIVTAKTAQDFLVVQIPIDTNGMPGAKYLTKGKLQHGMYCSVERGELLEHGKKVKWQMATASDAKGILPMWAQKMGVPGAVVKDVGLFIDWTSKRRAGKA
ncbi:hypothetical protein LTR78_005371 [Recurvomyces mirabilis]|uniref:DUF3074 domain-containing protein n=1 Tax=Recurvomyces mirabilis TaxID=574656 RepID=A0AAE0WN12_9PEZI|nr:hypothetical protein LTR78_005371 [Recurvomyces mirabilis]KAK5152722.1 hypothetical protein LTS14_008256 [Recurvomyces mirabilis]